MSAKTSQPLKQGKLPFASSKRTTSSTPANVKAKTSRSTKASPALRSISSSSSSANEVDVEDVHLTSDEEVTPEEHKKSEERPPTTTQVSSSAKSSTKKATTKPDALLQPKDKQENISPTPQERPELKEKDPRWQEHYAVVRKKMNYKKPIHGEGQNKIHEILRVFDLTYEYGPCVGVSRLERWERAQAMGLNPPAAVHEILSTRQGTEQMIFSQSVFNAEV